MKQDWKHILCCGVLFLILAAGLANLVWHTGYVSLDFPSNIFDGTVHRDSFFQESLANSIYINGYASFQMNSADFFNYHSFSSLVIGMLAKIAFVDIPVAYNFIYPVFFFPLYMFLAFTAVKQIRTIFKNNTALSIPDIIVAMIFFIGVLPPSWNSELKLFIGVWYYSEPQMIALVIALVFVCFAFWFYDKALYKNKVLYLLMLLVITPAFILMTTTSKISIGLAFCFAIMYYNFRKHLTSIKHWLLNVYYGMFFLSTYFLPSLFYSPFTSTSTRMDIYPFYFTDIRIQPAFRPLHFVAMYFFAAIAIWYGFRKAKSIKEVVKSTKYIVPEAVFFIAVMGFIIANIFEIHGASGWFFISTQALIGVILVLGYDIPNKLRIALSQLNQPIGEKLKYVTTVILAFAVFATAYNLQFAPVYNGNQKFAKGLSVVKVLQMRMDSSAKGTDEYRAELASMGFVNSIKGRLELIFSPNKYLQEPFLKNLEEIKDLTRGNEKDYYIFADENAELYDLYDNDSELRAALFYPANTGVVTIGAMYYQDGQGYYMTGETEKHGWYQPKTDVPKMDLDLAIEKATEDGKKALIYLFEDEYKVIKIK